MKVIRELLKYKIWMFCILFSVYMYIFSPAFGTWNNFYGILQSMFPYGMVALGLMFGLVTGINNLTIGSLACLSAVVFGLVSQSYGCIAGFLAGVAAAAVIGAASGVMSTYLKMDGWLVTIALMIGVRGFACALLAGSTVRITDSFFLKVASAKFGPVPLLFLVFLVTVVLVDFILKYTHYGRSMYAVGGNAEVAASCGININKVRVIAVIVSSVLAGIGGIFVTARLGSANGDLGADASMACLPMVIMGGAAFTGGKGDAKGTLSGCLVMNLITTYMNLFEVYIDAQKVIQGAILLMVIIADKYFENKEIKV